MKLPRVQKKKKPSKTLTIPHKVCSVTEIPLPSFVPTLLIYC